MRGQPRRLSEAIDYIDPRLPKDERNHRHIEAAREALYHAKDTGAKSIASAEPKNASNATLPQFSPPLWSDIADSWSRTRSARSPR